MTKSLALALILAFVGCKKNKADDHAATKSTDTPAATTPTPAAPTPAPTPSADTTATAPTAPPVTGTGTAGCAKYAEMAVKCGNHTTDPKHLEMSCTKTLEKNNAMTPTMKIEVDCAASNTDCDAFQKCIATTR